MKETLPISITERLFKPHTNKKVFFSDLTLKTCMPVFLCNVLLLFNYKPNSISCKRSQQDHVDRKRHVK